MHIPRTATGRPTGWSVRWFAGTAQLPDRQQLHIPEVPRLLEPMAAEGTPSLDELRQRFVSQLSPGFGLPDSGFRTQAAAAEDPFTIETMARIFVAIGPELIIDSIIEAFDGETVRAIAEALFPHEPVEEPEPTPAPPAVIPPKPSILIAAATGRQALETLRQLIASFDWQGWRYATNNYQPSSWYLFDRFVRNTRQIYASMEQYAWLDVDRNPYKPEPLKPAVQAVDILINFAKDSQNGQ